MILAAVIVAVGFAVGVWLLVSAIWPPRPALSDALARLHTPGTPKSLMVPTTASTTSWTVRTGRTLLRRVRVAAVADDKTLSDLAIVARPVEVYAGVCALTAVAGACIGPIMWLAASLVGGQLSVIVPLWLGAVGGVGGFFAPRLVLRGEAADARRDFRHALSAYLDVLVLLLAAGEGPEGAMDTAARAGTGRAFIELRRASFQARLSGDPIWDLLDETGRRLDVAELREIAAAGNLAGERGAAVRRSLMAKARALRSTSLSADETQARRRSQQMFLPVVVMGVGFILFLLYPLVTTVRIG
jgi:tight adherence protein C